MLDKHEAGENFLMGASDEKYLTSEKYFACDGGMWPAVSTAFKNISPNKKLSLNSASSWEYQKENIDGNISTDFQIFWCLVTHF